jgi:hypothetical protein
MDSAVRRVHITTAEQANAAHRRIVSSVQDAISIGEFLSVKKAELKHGEWLPWVEANLNFDRRTATNYMRLFDKWETVSHLGLSEAYKLLSDTEEEKKRRPRGKNILTAKQTLTKLFRTLHIQISDCVKSFSPSSEEYGEVVKYVEACLKELKRRQTGSKK